MQNLWTVSGRLHKLRIKVKCHKWANVCILQPEFNFLNQASFMKRNRDSIDTIKLTLRHYKQSNPAEPVNMLFLSDSTSLPCQSISGILKFKGNLWSGPLFCWPDLSPISRNFFTQALADPLRFCDLDVSGYKSHSFRIRQPPGQLPTACLMPRLGDGNLMPFSGTIYKVVQSLPSRGQMILHRSDCPSKRE